MIGTNEVDVIMCARELAVRERKKDGSRATASPKRRATFNQIVARAHVEAGCLEQILAAQIKVVCFEVPGGSLFDGRTFSVGESLVLSCATIFSATSPSNAKMSATSRS